MTTSPVAGTSAFVFTSPLHIFAPQCGG